MLSLITKLSIIIIMVYYKFKINKLSYSLTYLKTKVNIYLLNQLLYIITTILLILAYKRIIKFTFSIFPIIITLFLNNFELLYKKDSNLILFFVFFRTIYYVFHTLIILLLFCRLDSYIKFNIFDMCIAIKATFYIVIVMLIVNIYLIIIFTILSIKKKLDTTKKYMSSIKSYYLRLLFDKNNWNFNII